MSICALSSWAKSIERPRQFVTIIAGAEWILIDDQEVYGIIGEGGFERLIAAFYRQVPGDDILGPMYPADDLEGAERRLRDFLIFRFGGPQRYLAERGHPRLR